MSVSRLLACLASCVFLAGSIQGAPAAVSPEAARKLLEDLPLFFEPNQGQWNPKVKFSTRAGGYQLFLTAREALFAYHGPEDGSPRLAGFSLLNANPSPAAAGVDQLPSRSDYFRGRSKSEWRTGVAHYARVHYREVYPGIDLVYYGKQKRLEYDFILQPGADPDLIRLKFSGGRLELTPEGDLVLTDGGARLVQHRPYVYQDDPDSSSRRQVSGKYRLLGRNVVGFELGEYDRSRPLIIDPVVVFASFVGGAGSDGVTAVKLNSEGILYVLGYTNSADLTSTGNPYQAELAGDQDVFLARINPAAAGSGALISLTFFGGSGKDTPAGLALISDKIVCFTGSTNSTNLPLAIAYQRDLAGETDAFVAKFDYALEGGDTLFYSTYLGGSGADTAAGIDVDAEGKVYIIGTTFSENFPVSESALQTVRWGPQDAFIAKFDTLDETNSLLHSTYLGGESIDFGRAIAVSPDGMVYFAAVTTSTMFAGYGYEEGKFGGVDGVVGKLDLTQPGELALAYMTYLGGTGYDEPLAIAFDPSGKLLVTGYTLSTDLPTTDDAYQRELRGNADVFLARLDFSLPPEHAISYMTYFGGGGGEVAYGLATDAEGNVYLTGYTLSMDFPVTGDAWQRDWGWGVDIFVSKFGPDGALLYSTYLGHAGTHVGYSIAAGPDGSIYVGGAAGRKGISPTSNAFQTEYGGGYSDGFVVVFAP